MKRYLIVFLLCACDGTTNTEADAGDTEFETESESDSETESESDSKPIIDAGPGYDAGYLGSCHDVGFCFEKGAACPPPTYMDNRYDCDDADCCFGDMPNCPGYCSESMQYEGIDYTCRSGYHGAAGYDCNGLECCAPD